MLEQFSKRGEDGGSNHFGPDSLFLFGKRVGAVANLFHAFLFCAMRKAIHCEILLHAMAYNPSSAMRTGWRESVNCTFEAIEHVLFAS